MSNLIIGLTGGIGSGKSQVTRMLRDLGITVIDADAISRSLTAAGGLGLPKIASCFGQDFIDASGALDRAKMRQLVFKDPEAKRQLESILHPLIRLEAKQAAESAQGPYVVFDVPLLIESDAWRDQVDRVCVVDTEEQTQIDRVIQRDQLDLSTIQAIMEVQVTRQERLSVADDIILNDQATSLDTLKKRVDAKHLYWLELSGQSYDDTLLL